MNVARINLSDTTTWKDWQNGDVVNAEDYKRERNTIIAAINATDDEVKSNQNYFLVAQIMGVL